MSCKFCVVVIGLMMWSVLNLDLTIAASDNTTSANSGSENSTSADSANVTTEITTVAQGNGTTVSGNQTEHNGASGGVIQWNLSRMSMFLHMLLFGAIFSILVTSI